MSGSRERAKPAPTRPLVPKLAATASNFKSLSTPAPRLAPAALTPAAFSSPNLSRKPLSVLGNEAIPRAKSSNEATPASRLVESPNVTPRSSARKARTGSIHASPAGLGIVDTAPGTDRLQSSTLAVKASSTHQNASNLSAVRPAAHSRPGSSSSKSPNPNYQDKFFRLGSPDIAKPASMSSKSPMNGRASPHDGRFFYANDYSSQPTQRPPLQKKTSSTFLHADGRRDSDTITHTPRDSTQSISKKLEASTSEQQRPTLQHRTSHQSLNGQLRVHSTANERSPSPLLSSSPSGTSNLSPPVASLPLFRSSSPSKDNFHLSYRKGVSQIMRPHSVISPPRSQSRESARPPSSSEHRRQSSLDSISQPIDAFQTQAHLINGGTSHLHPASPSLFPPNETMGSPPLSPSLETSNISAVNSAATDARRERKVLDLEISNSSLLAINKSLEREVRKQKAELRRYRRMTRESSVAAFRASWLSEADISTAEFGNFDEEMLQREGEGQADSEQGRDDEDSDEELDDTSEPEDSRASSATSPGALAHHDAKHRESDRKRLHLELTKHKEILVDSQKMNIALRRCLGMTEQLIKDANKALRWNVQLNDVKLGGRVLFADDETDTGQYGENSLVADSEPSPYTRPGLVASTQVEVGFDHPGREKSPRRRTSSVGHVFRSDALAPIGPEATAIVREDSLDALLQSHQAEQQSQSAGLG